MISNITEPYRSLTSYSKLYFMTIKVRQTCWLLWDLCCLEEREASWQGRGVPSGNTFTWHLQVVEASVLLAVAITSPASTSAQSVRRKVQVPYWSLSTKLNKELKNYYCHHINQLHIKFMQQDSKWVLIMLSKDVLSFSVAERQLVSHTPMAKREEGCSCCVPREKVTLGSGWPWTWHWSVSSPHSSTIASVRPLVKVGCFAGRALAVGDSNARLEYM